MLTLDPAWTKIWIDAAQFLVLGAVGVHQWLIARDRVRGDQIKSLERDLDERLDETRTRVSEIEVRINHLPGHALCAANIERLTRLEEAFRHAVTGSDLNRLHQRIDELTSYTQELSGAVKEISATSRALERALSPLIEHHLSETRR